MTIPSNLRGNNTTQYLVDHIPGIEAHEFIAFMQEFRKKTNCRFRYKLDGRTTSPSMNTQKRSHDQSKIQSSC